MQNIDNRRDRGYYAKNLFERLSMKRTFGLTATLLILLAGLAAAQTPDEEYLKAMQVKDPCQQAQALDAYITNFAGKGGQYDNYAYAYYCLSTCPTKDAMKAVQYGEKALTMAGTDEDTKLKITFTIPQLYASAGQPDKAKAAAQKIIDLGKSSSNPQTSAKLQASGYILIGQFAEKSGDYAGAAQSYITAYGILKDPSILKLFNNLANTLTKAQKYAEAEQVFRQFYAADKGPESASLLAQTLDKQGKTDEALAIYREAYARKRTPALAKNIAILLNREVKKNPAKTEETINALIEASLLNPSDPASKAFLQGAKNLFVGQDKSLADINTQIQEHQKAAAELTKTFNDKYGTKNEEDLTDAEKRSMQKLNDAIAVENAAITKLQAQMGGVNARFDQLVAQIKSKLGK